MKKLTIIAYLGAEYRLDSLLESLKNQTEKAFEKISEILWIDENNIPYDTMFGYKMGFITRKHKEIKRVLRNLEGVLDDYDIAA